MTEFVLYGADYSVYTRIARLVLEEAGADYRLEPVDIFAEGGPPAGYLARHPFHKIPVLEHAGFAVYETDAIVDYIVAVTGVALVPTEPRARARMRQIMRIVDNYGYAVLVWNIYVAEYVRHEAVASETKTAAARVLRAIDEVAVKPLLLGNAMTLADCWVAPMIEYLRFAPTGRALLDEHSHLTRWWPNLSQRPSVIATRFADERGTSTG